MYVDNLKADLREISTAFAGDPPSTEFWHTALRIAYASLVKWSRPSGADSFYLLASLAAKNVEQAISLANRGKFREAKEQVDEAIKTLDKPG